MATHGFGVKLQTGNATSGTASTTWTDITLIRDLTPPTNEAEDMDATHHASAARQREFVAGLADGGEVEVECLYTHAGYLAVNTNFRVQKGYRIVFPLEGTDTAYSGFICTGYVKSIGPVTPIDDVMTYTATIKVTGDPGYDDSFTIS